MVRGLAGLAVFLRIFNTFGGEAMGIWLENPVAGWYFKEKENLRFNIGESD